MRKPTSDKVGDAIRDLNDVRIPTVCVPIPLYNHEKWIGKALESVDEQDYPQKFIVVVDDCSTDNSYQVVRENIKDEKEDTKGTVFGLWGTTPIILLKNEVNVHQAKSINRAFRVAWDLCQLFSILDADDYYMPTKISKSVAILFQDPRRIGLVYNDMLIYQMYRETFVHEIRRSYDRSVLEQENIISNAPLISKLALDRAGLYDEELKTCTDWDCWLRITEHFTAIHIPEPLHVYRVTGENMTFSIDDQQWRRDWQLVQNKLAMRKKYA